MGYAAQTVSARGHLEDKVAQALLVRAEPLLTSANANTKSLAFSIMKNPDAAARIVVRAASAFVGLTVESTDVDIDAALQDAQVVAAVQAHFGIGAP